MSPARNFARLAATAMSVALGLVLLMIVSPGPVSASTTATCPGAGNSCLPGIGDDYPYKNATMDAGSGYGGYYRECTDFVAWRLNRDGAPGWYNWGDAAGWDDTARAKGVTVNRTPALGAVAQWESNHVAYVAGWNADHSQIFIEEYNRSFDGTYGSRWISAASPTVYLHVHDLASSDPFGHFDSVGSPAPGVVHVTGWAFDPDSPASPVHVHVYVGGPAGSGAPGFDIGATTVSRPDVKAAYPQAGPNTGFDATVSGNFSGGLTVYVYAINVGPGANAGIGNLATAVANPRPLGNFDTVTSPAPGKVAVRGWAYDPNAPANPIHVHVYVGGPAGSGAPGFDIGATSTPRPDVVAVYPTAGPRTGFDATVRITGGGGLDVYVYAINSGPGDNVLLGSHHVSVTPAPPVPALVKGPTVSGTARVGSTLTCTAAYSGADTVTYRWRRDGAAIAGTGATRTLSPADYATVLTCMSTASNAGGDSATATSATGARVALGPALSARKAPTWAGRSKVGRTLTVTSKGAWYPAAESCTVQWLRNGKAIRGATGSTYRLRAKDRGKLISLRVTAKHHGYADGRSVSRRERV